MKKTLFLSVVFFSATIQAFSQLSERQSKFMVTTSVVTNGKLNVQNEFAYSDVLLIPFELKGTDPNQFSEYTRPTSNVGGYSIDMTYQIPVGSSLLSFQFDGGYQKTNGLSTVVGPLTYDSSTPPLGVQDQFSLLSIGGGLAIDLVQDPAHELQLSASMQYVHGTRNLTATLRDLSDNQPTESWNLYSNGIQYSATLRYNRIFSSGIGFTAGLTFMTTQLGDAYKAERVEFNVGDFELNDNTEVYWEYPNSEAQDETPLTVESTGLGYTRFFVGMLYAF